MGRGGEALLLKWYKKNYSKISGPWPLCTVSCLSLVGIAVGVGGRCSNCKLLTQKSPAFYICKNSCSLLLRRAALPTTPAPPTLPGRLVKENLFSLQKPLCSL